MKKAAPALLHRWRPMFFHDPWECREPRHKLGLEVDKLPMFVWTNVSCVQRPNREHVHEY